MALAVRLGQVDHWSRSMVSPGSLTGGLGPHGVDLKSWNGGRGLVGWMEGS